MENRKNLKSLLLFFIAFLILVLLGFPLVMLTGEKQGRVMLDEPVTLPFQPQGEKRVLLLYFGYAGCQSICSPSLQEIAAIYEEVNASTEVGFYFINIAKESGGLEAFVRYFNEAFVPVNLEHQQRQALMHALRAYSSDSLSGSSEISHTGYLYLIRQEPAEHFRLKRMYYTRPFERKSIVEDIKEELR